MDQVSKGDRDKAQSAPAHEARETAHVLHNTNAREQRTPEHQNADIDSSIRVPGSILSGVYPRHSSLISDTYLPAIEPFDRIPVGSPPALELQKLWVSLCPTDTWNSIALIPCDHKIDIQSMGHGIAQAASMDRHCKVLLIILGKEKKGTPKKHKSEPYPSTKIDTDPGNQDLFYEVLDLTYHQDRESIAYHEFLNFSKSDRGRGHRLHGHIILALGDLHSRPKGKLILQRTDFNYLVFQEQASTWHDVSLTAKIAGRNLLQGSISLSPT